MKYAPQFASVLLLALTGCLTQPESAPDGSRIRPVTKGATPPPVLHASGKTASDLREAMVRVYSKDGWKVEEESEQQLVFVKEVNDRAAKRWYAWRPDNPVVVREEIRITDAQGSLTATPAQEIVATYGSVTLKDPATSYEPSARRFDEVKAVLSRAPTTPIVGDLPKDWFTQVDPN